MINEWKYYNNALIPITPPHVNPSVPEKNFWKTLKSIGGGRSKKALFARWTTDFDCGYETDWWYVIKDDVFDISKLKAKRRYEINKGKKNFEVREIKAEEYADEIYEITSIVYQQYPDSYRPVIHEAEFKKSLCGWNSFRVYGAFHKESGKLCGYSWLKVYDSYVDFCVLKALPNYERLGINAAIVEKIVMDFNFKLGKDFYICDGARSTLHETAFQNYLEKYFGFRKAYCNLHMKYRLSIAIIVQLIYPFRNQIKKEGKLFSKIKTVLFFEKVARNCKNK